MTRFGDSCWYKPIPHGNNVICISYWWKRTKTFVFVKKLCHSVAVRWVLPLSDEVILHAKKWSIASSRLLCVCFEKRQIVHAMGKRSIASDARASRNTPRLICIWHCFECEMGLSRVNNGWEFLWFEDTFGFHLVKTLLIPIVIKPWSGLSVLMLSDRIIKYCSYFIPHSS